MHLGRRTIKDFHLSPNTWGYAYDYDKFLNPGVLNEFSAAAFRLHSLVMVLISELLIVLQTSSFV